LIKKYYDVQYRKIKEEYIMEKVKQMWALAVANKKVVIGIVVALIILINLVN
jgi:hypothetical protein|tara:strand:+ start:727 stop:882 length:156 start_codon:yes stop_codon:yes gene_type:complete